MLIHITPRFLPCARSGPHCDLVDLRIEQLDLSLRNWRDLRAAALDPGSPVLTVFRAGLPEPSEGILIETAETIDRFRVVVRWAVQASLVLTHVVDYVILDHEFDAVSDRMALWGATTEDLGGWATRVPPDLPVSNPALRQPRMDFASFLPRQGEVLDSNHTGGWVSLRREVFRMPTIEPGRLLTRRTPTARTPHAESAFITRATRGRAGHHIRTAEVT